MNSKPNSPGAPTPQDLHDAWEVSTHRAGDANSDNAQVAGALSARHLTVRVSDRHGSYLVLDDVAFDVPEGETLAIVGESGSGKSMAVRALLGALPRAATLESGLFQLTGRTRARWQSGPPRGVRGREIATVMQDPLAALNPTVSIGVQVSEMVRAHSNASKQRAKSEALEALGDVGIPDPPGTYDRYPHQLSGGLRQRVTIAMAIVSRPRFLIADEPTTALDLSVQAQIIDLLLELRRKYHLSVLLITHDLGVVAELASRITVLYAGRVMESGTTREVIETPKNPYTRALLESSPSGREGYVALRPIRGTLPAPWERAEGCWFAPRCYMATEVCRLHRPGLEPALRTPRYSNGDHLPHLSACHYRDSVADLDDTQQRIGPNH